MRFSTLAAFAALLFAAPSALAQPANDQSTNAVVIGASVTSATFSGTNVGATEKGDPTLEASCQSNSNADVWWRFEPTVDGTLTVDTAGSDFDTVVTVGRQGWTELACDDDSSVSTRSRVEDVAITAGSLYFIRIAGFSSAEGQIEFTYDYRTDAAPSNDEIANAEVVSSSPFSTTGTTVGATRETDFDAGTNEPEPACQDNYQATVWYSYTAPVAGDLTVDTEGSTFDTVLSITSEDGLTELACNDDGGTGTLSRIEDFALTGGQTVLIRVAVFGDGGTGVGDFTLNLELDANQPNDDRDGATELSPVDFVIDTNYGATVEGDEPVPSCQPSSNSSVWYSFTAPSAGNVSLNTNGSEFDTVLTLHDAGDLSEIACDDDGGDGTRSLLEDVAVDAGQTVLIRVADFGSTRNHGIINLDFEFMSTVNGEATGTLVDALDAMPNPMRGSGRVSLSVAEAQTVRVDVIDVQGRRVATLHDGAVTPGQRLDLAVAAADLPAGVYVVRAQGESLSLVRQITVVR